MPSALVVGVTLLQPRKNVPVVVKTLKRGEPPWHWAVFARVNDPDVNVWPSSPVITPKAEAFVSLDKGLSVISRHAKNLGYDAIILFLDELILWLASHAADLKFVHQEGQKLAKLVEYLEPQQKLTSRKIPVLALEPVKSRKT